MASGQHSTSERAKEETLQKGAQLVGIIRYSNFDYDTVDFVAKEIIRALVDCRGLNHQSKVVQEIRQLFLRHDETQQNEKLRKLAEDLSQIAVKLYSKTEDVYTSGEEIIKQLKETLFETKDLDGVDLNVRELIEEFNQDLNDFMDEILGVKAQLHEFIAPFIKRSAKKTRR